MRPADLLPAIVEALLLQVALVLTTTALPGEAGAYGAPLPVGHSSGFGGAIALGGQSPSFSWPAFLLDVVLTAAPLVVVTAWGGIDSGIAGLVGGALVLALTIGMYSQLYAGLPFAGLPIPVADRPGGPVNQLLLWIDALGAALLVAAAWHTYRSRAG